MRQVGHLTELYGFRCQLDFLCVPLKNVETEDGVNRICTCHVIMFGQISNLIKNIYIYIYIYIYICRKLSISYVQRGYNG